MLMTVTHLPTTNDAWLPHSHTPPPLLPKPGKENIRLQKVLQKAAKKKNPPGAVAQPKAFRTTLSPVSEASPDFEHCERISPHRPPTPRATTPRASTPRPTTPRPTTPSFLGVSLPPRFYIKPVVHHVSSPYPQHRSFTFTVTEQRSLSECLRRTPSPRPPSPSVRQVIPPLQLQQPPQTKADGRTPSPRPPSPSVRQVISPLQLQQPPKTKADGRTPSPRPPSPSVRQVMVHHVSSPYPQHRSFTFTVTEQRSLSECLRRTPSPRPPSPSVRQVSPPLQLQQPPQTKADGRTPSPRPPSPSVRQVISPLQLQQPPKTKADGRTPSPRPPSPSVRQVIPPLQLQQPPQTKAVGPQQGFVPNSSAHLKHPIPVIVEPVAPFVITPNQSTPVIEVTVQEVDVNAQARLPEAVCFREGSTIRESVQKTANLKGVSNHTVVCQSESSNMVATVTILHMATNAALPKTIHDTASTHTPEKEHTLESAHGPRTCSIQPNTPSDSKGSSTLHPVVDIRSQSPKQQDAPTTQPNYAQTAQVTITSQHSITVEKTEVPPAPQGFPAKNKPTISDDPKSEPLLKSAEKVKPPRTKLSGWSRLKKHLVVEPEEPKFPVPESEEPKHIEENKRGRDGEDKTTEKTSKPKESRANKMWDALLYQMSSPKEYDKRKEDKEVTGERGKEEKPPFFRCRLPLLLYRPRFDARKLREAASRPLRKITTMFDLGRLNRKITEEEPKDFNRTASGWQLK